MSDVKRKPGRPVINATPINVRLHPDEVAALDKERGKATRPQAIRKIVRERLIAAD